MLTQSTTLMFLCGIMLCAACNVKDGINLEKQIISIEHAALDRWNNGDTSGYLEIYADEITYFDPSLEIRIDGLEAMKQLYAPIEGKIKTDRYKMINPKVQIYNTTAVLTYNLVVYMRTKEESMKKSYWNSTEVYTKINEEWKIIHSHWSPFNPKS